MDFQEILDFVKSKRPTLLLVFGVGLLLVWIGFMSYYQLYDLSPYGPESRYAMSGALWLYGTTTALLLGVVFWLGSAESPISDEDPAWDFAQKTYVAFKNFIFVVVILVFVAGAPQLRYYSQRAERIGTGEFELSYYEQRTWSRVVSDLFRVIGQTSEHSEESVPVGGFDLDMDSDNDSDSSSSSSSDSDGLGEGIGGLGALLLAIVTYLVTGALIILFIALVVMSFAYSNFWLVAMFCLAIAMILLGTFDVIDGPRV